MPLVTSKLGPSLTGIRLWSDQRWSQTATGTGYASAVQPQLTFNGSNGVNTNRIDGWSYDNAGNLLNDKIHTYTYDAENRIATLSGAPEYIYDAEGRRVAKTNSSGAPTSVYILGLGGEQVTELNSSGAWVHSNVFAGGGRLLVSYEGPAGTDTAGYHYHLTDWLGTKRMQTTATGNQEETCMSYPFGDGLSCTGGADATEHHFTGKERDTESGLDYFEARYLTSDLGRFMTPDWADFPEAVPYADFGNPQSLNLYEYVLNNPTGKPDEDGHCGDICGWFINTVSTFLADHPKIGAAFGKVADSSSVTPKVGLGVGGKMGAVEAGASWTGSVKIPANPEEKPTIGNGVAVAAKVGPVGVSGTAGVSKQGQEPASVDGSVSATLGGASTTISSSGDDGGETSYGFEAYAIGGGGIDFSVSNAALSGLSSSFSDAVMDGVQSVVDTVQTMVSTAGCGGAGSCGSAALNGNASGSSASSH